MMNLLLGSYLCFWTNLIWFFKNSKKKKGVEYIYSLYFFICCTKPQLVHTDLLALNFTMIPPHSSHFCFVEVHFGRPAILSILLDDLVTKSPLILIKILKLERCGLNSSELAIWYQTNFLMGSLYCRLFWPVG